MTATRNSSAMGFGTRRAVPRNDRGTASTTPRQVPASAIQTVSSSRYPRPLASVSKKKAQSGCSRPETMARTVWGLVWEKSGGWRDRVHSRTSRAAASQSTRFCAADRRRSSRMICERKRLRASMAQTVRNRQSKIMPTLPYSSHDIFSFSSRQCRRHPS